MIDTLDDDVAAGLRAWARGCSRSAAAAVEFLLATRTDLVGVGLMVRTEGDGRYYLDVFTDDVDVDVWARRTGWMSSGQRATWNLVRSLCDGELGNWFYRLDASRKRALLDALGAGLAEEEAHVARLLALVAGEAP